MLRFPVKQDENRQRNVNQQIRLEIHIAIALRCAGSPFAGASLDSLTNCITANTYDYTSLDRHNQPAVLTQWPPFWATEHVLLNIVLAPRQEYPAFEDSSALCVDGGHVQWRTVFEGDGEFEREYGPVDWAEVVRHLVRCGLVERPAVRE